MQHSATRLVACPQCELCQYVAVAPETGYRVECVRCANPIERGTRGGTSMSLACWLAVIVLLIGLLATPIVHAMLYGRRQAVTVADGPLELARGGWPLLAALTLLLAAVVPLVRAALVVTVLCVIQLDRRPPWLGSMYRRAQRLRPWAIPEVFALGYGVTLTRAADSIALDFAAGTWILLALVLVSMVANATLEDSAVWRAIRSQPPLDAWRHASVCPACAFATPRAPAGTDASEPRCPRCGTRRTPLDDGTTTAAALVATSYVLLVPAYLLVVGTRLTPFGVDEFTIPGGAREMAASGYWPLAIIIVVASIAVPLAKLLGLSWLLFSINRRSDRRLVAKARTYRMVHAIGRWSFTDMFVAAATVALLAFPPLVVTHTGPAMLPFVVVVILTMLASHAFEPRLLWRAATTEQSPAETVAMA